VHRPVRVGGIRGGPADAEHEGACVCLYVFVEECFVVILCACMRVRIWGLRGGPADAEHEGVCVYMRCVASFSYDSNNHTIP
jgi:hypothetical protein